jgi:predicted metal-dependent peptidase
MLDKKLLKAKIELMTRSVFLSTINLSIKHIISDEVLTAGTDCKQILYNPDFCKNLSILELTGLMAHECWHIAFMHKLRQSNRDQVLWNKAADYVINNMLLDSKYTLPPGGLVDKAYTNMSTEQVYDILVTNNESQEDYALSDLLEAEGDAEDATQAIKSILVKAVTQSKIAGKSAGEIPKSILRDIDELINPKLPWHTLLNKFINTTVKTNYTWARRNRRYKSVYLPSLHSYGLSSLTFAIDTSGSVTSEELRNMLSEIRGIQNTFRPKHMKIIDCDSVIHNVFEIDYNTDILSLDFTGGGGTNFDPVMEYVSKNATQALIYFTDLYANVPTDPKIPVLWVCTSDKPAMPFGRTVYFN